MKKILTAVVSLLFLFSVNSIAEEKLTIEKQLHDVPDEEYLGPF